MTDATSSYRLGDWLIEPARNRLSRDDESHQLEAKAMDVLVYLMEHADEVVPTDALLDDVWPGRVVEQSTAHRRINQIRKVLGDDPKAPTYIETIPKRGYRLIAQASLVTDSVSPDVPATIIKSRADLPRSWGAGVFVILATIAGIAAWLSASLYPDWFRSGDTSAGQSTNVSPARAIAVLPFVNLSDDPEQEYFSDGVARDILSSLARNPDLTVRPPSSSFHFKGSKEDSQSIGKMLKATHVLEGSVRSSGKRIRLSVNLVDVATNRSVWTERYDRELTDVFAIQDAITSEVLSSLNARFRGDSPGAGRFASLEAYDAYLRGRHYMGRAQFPTAMQWLEQAVSLDDGSAEIWAALASGNFLESARELKPNTGEHADLRRQYIEKTLRLDPDNAEALARQAMDTLFVDRDYQRAIEQSVSLVRRHPNSEPALAALTSALSVARRPELAAMAIEKMLELSPVSGGALVGRVLWELMFGTTEAAKEALKELTSLGNWMPAMHAQTALAERDPDALRTVISGPRLPGGPGSIFPAFLAYMEGRFDEAAALVAPLKNPAGYQSNLMKCRIALVEQDWEAAFEAYRNALRTGEPGAFHWMRFPLPGYRVLFPEFYDDPRFGEILQEFGLDPDSLSKLRIPELPFQPRVNGKESDLVSTAGHQRRA